MSFENGWIDLRSDTVTQPTPAMRAAMANAIVGDDVYNDDPTVIQLQNMAAELTGHEAGLFVASGTMGNLVALMTYCGRGHEVLLGDKSHIFLNEAGGLAGLVGAQAYPLPNQADGTLRLSDIENAIRYEDEHHPRTRVICLENTQNICGGVPLTPEYTQSVAELAHARGLILHLDGARLFNAAVAQGVSAKALAAPADSVTFCLSKGLGSPIGSVLCGSAAFIAEARRARKMVGGGLRQVGVVAAAGIVSLQSMVERLDDDHTHARQLSEGLRAIPGFDLDPTSRTNMVYFYLSPESALTEARLLSEFAARHINISGADAGRYRLVTHAWVTAEDVGRVLAAFREVMRAG